MGERGLYTQPVAIRSIEPCGKENVYDVEMAAPNHTFVTDQGIVTCNSHSVAYSIISYQTAWLRTHYPTEFYTALLNASFKDQEDLVKYIYACREAEIPIQPPDVNISEGMFTINNGTIIFGLAGIKGLGPKACDALVEERNTNGPFKSLEEMVQRKINKGTVKALAACGALGEITEFSRGQLVKNLDELYKYYEKHPKWVERVAKIKEKEKACQIDFDVKQSIRDEKIKKWKKNPKGREPKRLKEPKPYKIPEEPQLPEMNEIDEGSRQDRLALERQTLGFYLTGHPMDEYPGLSRLARHTVAALKEGEGIEDGMPINIPVVVSAIRKIRTKSGMNMAVVNIEDKSGRMEATIFPRQWRKLEKCLEEDTVNIVSGSVRVTAPESDDSPPLIKVIINDLELVTEDNEAGHIHPITLTVQDGTLVEFIPREDVSHTAYQQALAVATNMKRMR
jgi:DNA polymerase-3 subunit alpha